MPPSKEAPRRLVKWATGLVVIAWIPCTLVLTSLLMVGHLLTLPRPAMGAKLERALEKDASAEAGRHGWFALHVMAEQCNCSRRVLEHLIERGGDPSLSEKVVLIGSDEELRRRLTARGFGFETLTAEQLHDRYGVDGAPLLLVIDPQGRVAYSGGYSTRAGGEPRDSEILAALQGGGRPEALPLFGCAVSRELQRKLDPLGMKYGSNEGSKR
jgi:hypothetical protein